MHIYGLDHALVACHLTQILAEGLDHALVACHLTQILAEGLDHALVACHLTQILLGHLATMINVKILSRELECHRLRVKEAIYIKDPTMNHDQGTSCPITRYDRQYLGHVTLDQCVAKVRSSGLKCCIRLVNSDQSLIYCMRRRQQEYWLLSSKVPPFNVFGLRRIVSYV